MLVQQVVAQRTGTHREDDVVEAHPGGALDALEPVDAPRLGGHPSRTADRHVEHGARRSERQRQLLLHQRGAGQRPRRRAKCRNRSRQLGDSLGRFDFSAARVASGQIPDRLHVGVLGVGRQRPLHELQRGDTVDQRVVELAVEGEPAVVQPLDEVRFPQRAVSVEQAAVPPRGQLEQLADPSRRRQRRAPHVIVDVDVIRVVVGPRDVGDSAERPGRVLPEGGLEIAIGDQSVVDFPDELRPGALWRLEQLQSADVHGVLARFGQQKHRVERTH